MKPEHSVIVKYQRLLARERITWEQAHEAWRDYGRSLTLGRNFGETMEDYEARKPDVRQFFTELNELTATLAAPEPQKER